MITEGPTDLGASLPFLKKKMTPENDLVPMDQEGPKCGKNSLPLSFPTECSTAERLLARLLQSRHEAADARRREDLVFAK